MIFMSFESQYVTSY